MTDKLKDLKDLLDIGAITTEEYEEKKLVLVAKQKAETEDAIVGAKNSELREQNKMATSTSGRPRVVLKRADSAPQPEQRSNSAVIILVVVSLLVFGVASLVIFKNEIHEAIFASDQEVENQIDTSEEYRLAQNESVKPEKKIPDLHEIVSDYIEAQDQRDIFKLLGYWNPTARRYYNRINITAVDIQTSVQNSWDNTTYSKNTILSILEVNDSTIQVEVQFDFTRKKNNEEGSVQAVNIYEFGRDGRLNAEYQKYVSQ